MSLVLKSGEVCPHSSSCPYANAPGAFCWGTKLRERDFACDYVREDGTIIEGKHVRGRFDLTGKMEILHEGA